MKVVFRSNESLSTSQNGFVISNLGFAFRQCIRARSHAPSKAFLHRYTLYFFARRHSQSVNTEPAARPPPALAIALLRAFIPHTNANFSPRQLTLPLRPTSPPIAGPAESARNNPTRSCRGHAVVTVTDRCTHARARARASVRRIRHHRAHGRVTMARDHGA